VPYHSRIGPALKRLGLYHLSQLAELTIDAGLISGLIERWRPETHTFHMPVGEMTVTLQDVSCLWGLPITGQPVTGIEYGDYDGLIEDLLGLPPDEEVQKKRKKGGIHRVSRAFIHLPQLRLRFAQLDPAATDDEVDHYTRAYILDMFATWMFPDSSGDTVPVVYLHFLRDLHSPAPVNWGSAVLALLYRGLCNACQIKFKTFVGPAALLQHWSYSRLPVARPKPLQRGWTPDWGEPDGESCPAYAERWSSKKMFDNCPHGATVGITFFRTQLDCLTDEMVDWQPYEAYFERRDATILQLLPAICRTESQYWLARVPLIHFSVIEHTYPDRVMRQFGMAQLFPPQPAIPEDYWRRLHARHAAVKNKDWSTVYSTEVSYASAPSDHLVPVAPPYNYEQFK